MSLSFNNLCLDNNAVFNTFENPSPIDQDLYKVFPTFDKIDFLLEKDSKENTHANTNSFPTPHLSPALVNTNQ